MQDERPSARQTAARKLSERFRSAFRGIWQGVRREGNFRIHLAFAAAVLIAAAALHALLWEWSALIICIGSVLATEMFNTAIERAAKAITAEHNEHLRDALDIASAAVLVAAVSASIVGTLVLGHRLGLLFGWWAS